MPDQTLVPLTDEQLRRLTSYVHPDEGTDYVRAWLHSMASERTRADQRAADDGAAYSVVELREVSDRGE